MSNTEETPLLPSLEGRKRSHASQTISDCGDEGGYRSSISRRSKWVKWGGSTAAGVMMFAAAGFGLTMIFYSVRKANSNSEFSTSFSNVLTRGPLAWTVQGTAREYTDQSDTKEALFSLEKDYRNRDEKEEHEEMGEDRDTAPNGESRRATRPNVFFILIDDMGWNDIGYQSTDLWGLTPNMDKLAENGIKLTNYYSMSICTPARASLMTGRYTTRYGLQYEVIQPGAPWGLPLGEKLMPEYLNEAGYESHMVGKWHMGSYTHSHTPQRRGFKTFLGYLNDEETYWTHQSWTASFNDIDFFDFGFGNETGYYDIINRDEPHGPRPTSTSTSSSDGLGKPALSFSTDRDPAVAPPLKKAAPGGGLSASDPDDSIYTAHNGNYIGMYSTRIFNDRAMEIIGSKTPFDEEPLFLYLAHQAVHEPLGEPDKEAFSSEEWAMLEAIHPTSNVRTRFAKALLYLDKTIGFLMKQLEEQGWLENSIVVLTSDNGGCPTHGGSNYPLRGIKHSYWEGGTKVPAIVYSKSHLPKGLAGATYDGLMHVTDWLPTLMAAIGEEVTGSAGPLDGVNHWNYIMGVKGSDSEPSPRTEMLYNWDPYTLWSEADSIEEPEYPLPQGAFRQGKYKLLRNVWCTGYSSFDPIVDATDSLCNESNTCLEGGSCNSCGMGCVSSANHSDWLIDLESDPREERNLILELPELAKELRDRATEIAFREWTNSLHQDIEPSSYTIWSELGYWMAPWFHLYTEALGNSTTSDDGESWSSSQ